MLLVELERLPPREVANTLWAVAKLRISHLMGEGFVAHWITIARPKLRSFNGKDMYGTLWALAELEVQGPVPSPFQLLFLACSFLIPLYFLFHALVLSK